MVKINSCETGKNFHKQQKAHRKHLDSFKHIFQIYQG